MWMAMLVTAYCLTGTTSSGIPVHKGTVAVDPRVIRMGSHMYIPGYGHEGHAEDTGNSIKGYHIDIWMSSCFLARQWGARRKRIRVYR